MPVANGKVLWAPDRLSLAIRTLPLRPVLQQSSILAKSAWDVGYLHAMNAKYIRVRPLWPTRERLRTFDTTTGGSSETRRVIVWLAVERTKSALI